MSWADIKCLWMSPFLENDIKGADFFDPSVHILNTVMFILSSVNTAVSRHSKDRHVEELEDEIASLSNALKQTEAIL